MVVIVVLFGLVLFGFDLVFGFEPVRVATCV